MKKKIVPVLLIMVLLVSAIGTMTASAGIKGSSEVVAGKSYTYTISVSGSASTIGGSISWSGFDSGSDTFWADSKSGMNENITASKSITIKVPAGTPEGSTCTIKVSGQISTFDGTNVGESNYSKSKTITVVKKTSSPSSNNNDKDDHDDKPKATPTPTEWDLAAGQVDGLTQGGILSIDITGEDRTIPASLFNAIREKQGVVTLNFGTYTCTLNGAVLGELDEEAKKLNLGLSLEADPDLSAAVGGADVYQLHFSHEGEFPGKISFTFKADKSSPGDTVYLYYYRSGSGVTEGKQSAVVDASGYVTFDIYHCSSYFVSGALIEGAAGIVAAPEPTSSLTPEPTPEPTPAPSEEPVKEVAADLIETGFSLPVLIAVGSGAALLAIIVTLAIVKAGPFKKRSRHAE